MKKNTWLFDYFWLTLALLIFFGIFLGSRVLSVPDEGRYSEIPREMLLFHDFITPHLDGIKYFEKPPLLYWIQTAAISLFGINEWGLRLPTALFAVLGSLSVYTAGRFLLGRVAAILATLVLATSPLYFAMAHSITLDMAVSVFITITLLSFITAIHLPELSRARRNVCWLMFIAAALALLTKGLIGIALPGLVIITWLLIFNRWRELTKIHFVSGLIIFLLISLPWHILVQIKNPEFFYFYFIKQHVLRYLTKAMDRYQPVWWFIPILVIGLFPWIIFLYQALRDAIKISWADRWQKSIEIFLFIWAVEIFLFFSFSDSKLIPYILPVFPPVALLIGNYFYYLISRQNKKAAFMPLVWLSLALSFALFFARFLPLPLNAAQLLSLKYMAIPLILMAIGVYLLKGNELKISWVILTQVIFLGCFLFSVPNFDLRSVKPLALMIKQLAKPGDVVVNYGEYHQDLPVYSQHLVLIVNWINELEFGAQHQLSAKERLINPEQFWLLWQKPHRVFAIMDVNDYQAALHHHHAIRVLAKYYNHLLISNQ
jgi:4-amino-4-deoxy-L-arabinose transferase-like glycosyltransferase